MKAWVDLYSAHQALRAQGAEAEKQIREVLRRLGEQHPSVFQSNVQSRLQPQRNPETGLQVVELNRARRGEEVHLHQLPAADQREVHLKEARLTVLLLLDRSRQHLHQLTVMVEGKRSDNSPWTVAVHLPDDRPTVKNPAADRQGHGGCGHAALHCHVGPTLDVQPKVRVPLPTPRWMY